MRYSSDLAKSVSGNSKLLIVVESRDDLVKWFRQIPLFSGDHCLQCYHWGGIYIVDMHVQTGRQSSANGA